jgi:hypothetical protein
MGLTLDIILIVVGLVLWLVSGQFKPAELSLGVKILGVVLFVIGVILLLVMLAGVGG